MYVCMYVCIRRSGGKQRELNSFDHLISLPQDPIPDYCGDADSEWYACWLLEYRGLRRCWCIEIRIRIRIGIRIRVRVKTKWKETKRWKSGRKKQEKKKAMRLRYHTGTIRGTLEKKKKLGVDGEFRYRDPLSSAWRNTLDRVQYWRQCRRCGTMATSGFDVGMPQLDVTAK